MLDKRGAGVGAECHDATTSLWTEAVKKAQEDTQEASGARGSETCQAFLSISLLRLEMQRSSYGHRLPFPAPTKQLTIMYTSRHTLF